MLASLRQPLSHLPSSFARSGGASSGRSILSLNGPSLTTNGRAPLGGVPPNPVRQLAPASSTLSVPESPEGVCKEIMCQYLKGNDKDQCLADPTIQLKQFRRLALELHPDKSRSSKDTTADFQELNNCYQLLFPRQLASDSGEDSSSFQGPTGGGAHAPEPSPHSRAIVSRNVPPAHTPSGFHGLSFSFNDRNKSYPIISNTPSGKPPILAIDAANAHDQPSSGVTAPYTVKPLPSPRSPTYHHRVQEFSISGDPKAEAQDLEDRLSRLCREHNCHGERLKQCIEKVRIEKVQEGADDLQEGADDLQEEALESNPDYVCPKIYHAMDEADSSDEETSSAEGGSNSSASLDDMCKKYNCRRRSLRECTGAKHLTQNESQLLQSHSNHVCREGARGVVQRKGAASAVVGGLSLLKNLLPGQRGQDSVARKYRADESLDIKIEKRKRELDLRKKRWEESSNSRSKPPKVLNAEWDDINRGYAKLKELQAQRTASQIELTRKKISDNREEMILRAREGELFEPGSKEFDDMHGRYRETARKAAGLYDSLAQQVRRSSSTPVVLPQAAFAGSLFAGSKFFVNPLPH